jgi:hypothetical protein
MRLTVLKKKIDINILDKYYCLFKKLFAFDDLVKSSRCKARKSDGRGNPPGCPIPGGSASRPYLPQRRS